MATRSCHPAYHYLSELVPDFLRGPIRIYDRHAARFIDGERQKPPAHPSMKAFCLSVQPILLFPICSPSGQAD